jgi:hypothetical protein
MRDTTDLLAGGTDDDCFPVLTAQIVCAINAPLKTG